MNILKSIFRRLFSDEISSLEKQVQSKQKALAGKEATIKGIRREKQRLVSQLDSCKQEISNLENQANILQGTISGRDDELSTKNQRIIVLERSLAEKKTESENDKELIKEYRQHIDSLKSAKNELERLIDSQKQQIKDNEIQIQQFENRSRLASEQTESLNSHKSVLEIKIQELTHKLNEAQRTAVETEKVLAEKSDNLQSKESELTVVKEAGKTLEDEVNRLTGLLSERKEQIDSLTSRNDGLEAEKQSLLAKLNEQQNKSADEELLTALKNDVKQKQESISVLESDIQQLNEELSSIRLKNSEANNILNEKIVECEELKKDLQSITAQYEEALSKDKSLGQLEKRIAELENSLKNAPTLNELIKRDREIERLKAKIREYEAKINVLVSRTPATEEPNPTQAEPSASGSEPTGNPDTPQKTEPTTYKTRPVYRKPKFPYRKKPIAPSKDVVTVDFPVIENDNVYSQTSRLIDKVFNHRSNSFITANDIFLHKSVEEISRMRFELEDATRTGVPYLTCPCCGNMVKISSRSVGFGLKSKEVQFFSHAVKNVPCDLKRDNSYSQTIDDGENGENDFSYLKELRNLLANSLRSEISLNKGLSNVEDGVYIHSGELPIMKRRLADVAARYNDIDIVFELVTPTTHVARVHDRDIFYLINHKQVFWIFGLESIVDYNELRRSVSKDIFFTNKRNVFVFDLEAQEESKCRGELMLKCNWLDEDGAWYYQVEKNGKNGILISIDQIHFEQDSCRPYFYDADEPFYLKHPTAERPPKLSREKLKEDIIEAWSYEQERKRAIERMLRENRSVVAFFDGQKWGFKFEDIIFIEPVFDSKPLMLGDFAKVEKDGKYGVVNKYGEYRLQTEYDKVSLLQNGYILYASKGNWYLFGVIDPLTSFATNDEVVVSTISKSSSIYHLIIKKYLFEGQQPEEFYFVGNEIFKKNSSSSKWSLWQSNGEKVTDISWDSLEFTSDDMIKVSSNGRTQLLALDGTVIKEQKYKSESKLSNGYLIVETFDEYWGITDSNGLEIVLPQYDVIVAIDDNFLKAKKGNKWGIISSTGQLIAATLYSSIDGFDGKYFVVTKPNETRGWGHLSGKLDYNGNPVSEIVSQVQNGIAITKSFEKIGLEANGNVFIPHIYDYLSKWDDDKYIAQKDNNFGIIDCHNKVLLNFEYSSITPLKEGKSTVKKGSSQHDIDANLKIVEDIVINLQEGYKKVKLGGKWGVLNPKGQVIVDYLYDEITTFRGRLVGIINGRLIKLNAYYPYRLAMKAINIGIVESRDLIYSGGVKFQNFKRRISPQKDQEISVALINWTTTMKYPIVLPYDKGKHTVRVKHVDKPTDFLIGDSFDVKVKSIIKGSAKNKRKGVGIVLPNGLKSYIFKKDFNTVGIDLDTVNIGDSFHVTKLGFDEELDRTQWRVKRI
ncbi:MAG: WG repeat-containing protein [Muribaculaceae bacterium]|nr:WG repeat-containing protein [Muribaculaceae bacterium]